MENYFEEPGVVSMNVSRRSAAAKRSQRSYNNNKTKVARRRILNAIAKGRCVLRRTLNDPKYGWTQAERAMLQRCLDLRRTRYAIAPERITSIRDKRYQRQTKELDLLASVRQKLRASESAGNSGVDELLGWVQGEIDRRDVVAVSSPPPGSSEVTRYPFPSPPQVRSWNNNNNNNNNNNRTTSAELRPERRRRSPTQSPAPSSNQSDRSRRNSPNNAVVLESGITKEDVVEAYEYMIKKDIIYEHRSRNVKSKGVNEYARAVERLFSALAEHSFPTNDLMDVYRRPTRYKNITKANKKWLQILFKLHNTSCRNLFRANRVALGIVDLCHKVDNVSQIMEQFSVLQNRDKEAEENRRKNAPYFDWNDIMRIPELIRGNTVQANRDRIIMRIYIFENIVRDNLGHILLLSHREAKEARRSRRVDYNYVYRDENTERHVILLNDFKNVRQRGPTRIEVGDETSKLIDTYLGQMRERVGPSKTIGYLITKNDGEPYRDGKLSRYIIDMFKRYTGMKHLGINELRHSVATHYKNESETFKARLARKMQHSLPQHLKYERYSNKVIRIPVFHPEAHLETLGDPFENRSIKILIGRVIHNGVVHRTSEGESDKEYKVIFDDDSVPPRFFSSTDIAIRLESDDVMLNIGKRIRYKLASVEEEAVFGAKGHVDGEIALNEAHFYDSDAPPYRLETGELRVEKTFHLPHPNITLL